MLMIIVNAFVFFVSYFDEQESRTPWCTVHFVSLDTKQKGLIFILFSGSKSFLYQQMKSSISPVH